MTDQSYRVAEGELRSFVERYERLDAEKQDIADQQKEIKAEAYQYAILELAAQLGILDQITEIMND